MIPESSIYKGWRVLVFNMSGFTWESSAIRAGSKQMYASGGMGKGSKQRAFDSIKKQIDEQEAA